MEVDVADTGGIYRRKLQKDEKAVQEINSKKIFFHA